MINTIGNDLATKPCSVCKEVKNRREFPKNYNKQDGRKNICYKCENDIQGKQKEKKQAKFEELKTTNPDKYFCHIRRAKKSLKGRFASKTKIDPQETPEFVQKVVTRKCSGKLSKNI